MAAGEARAGSDAPFGEGAALRRMAGTVPAPPPNPASPAPARRVPVQPVLAGAGAQPDQTDVSGGYDEALFAPTDRPDEPITHGAPFGPGANFTVLPYENQRGFLLRVASQLEGSGTPGLKPYLDKLRAGG